MSLVLVEKELIEKLAEGTCREHRFPNVELRSNWSQESGKKISAHANNYSVDTAWLVVGVDDTGVVVGRDEEWARKTEQQIANHLIEYLDPAQACRSVRCHALPSGWVVLVAIAPPGAVTTWNKRAYKLIGTATTIMEPDEIMALTVTLPGLEDFSRQPFRAEVDSTLVRAYARKIAGLFPRSDLDIPEDKGVIEMLGRLSIANTQTARILFGDCQWRLIVSDSDGTPIRNEQRRGLAQLVLPEVQAELDSMAQLQCPDDTLTLFPEEKVERGERVFPEKAIAEALANAVAHAAYFERDGELIVELSPGKIEISNLCLQDSAYFANRWFSRGHHTVNPLLMETLRLGGVVDELGRGKSVIYRESILAGHKPPLVEIQPAGRVSRWRISLWGGLRDERLARLLERLRDHYNDGQKALIGCALVLWRNKKVSEIRQYIDGESALLFAEVLADLEGPVFFIRDEDRIVLSRWAAVLIGEGKDTKKFSDAEEQRLFDLAYRICTTYDAAIITPKRVRELGAMGESKAARTVSSNLLRKWEAEGKVAKLGVGRYKFEPKADIVDIRAQVLHLLQGTDTARSGGP